MVPEEEMTKPPPLDTTMKVQSGETMFSPSQRGFDQNGCKEGKICQDNQGGLDTIITTGQCSALI